MRRCVSTTGGHPSGIVTDLEHLTSHRRHDLDPPLCSPERVLPLLGLRLPPFEIGKWLQHDDLQTSVLAHCLDLFRRITQVREILILDVLLVDLGSEIEEIGESELNALETGARNGVQLFV